MRIISGIVPRVSRKAELQVELSKKDKLSQAEFKGNIEIPPKPKCGYTRVRTSYLLPSPDLFEAIDIIAKYIKYIKSG